VQSFYLNFIYNSLSKLTKIDSSTVISVGNGSWAPPPLDCISRDLTTSIKNLKKLTEDLRKHVRAKCKPNQLDPASPCSNVTVYSNGYLDLILSTGATELPRVLGKD
jgi:hypothetical protein